MPRDGVITVEIFGSDPISVAGSSVFIGTVLRYGR